jgi:hypothetical protein
LIKSLLTIGTTTYKFERRLEEKISRTQELPCDQSVRGGWSPVKLAEPSQANQFSSEGRRAPSGYTTAISVTISRLGFISYITLSRLKSIT